MGVVNVTPDSFSDGGRYLDADAAVARGVELAGEGADLLDVGGESTRPGATRVGEAEETQRVVPVIAALASRLDVPISVDTTKSGVATAALAAGATVVNDVSAGLADDAMLGVVADAGAGFVAMHMQGDPRTMQQDPRYDDVVAEIREFLVERLDAARAAGIGETALCADPGIGFGKTTAHNLQLLANLRDLVTAVGVPVMVGTSRKSFLAAVLGERLPADAPADARDDATLATLMWAIEHGAAVLRVHAARPAADAVWLWDVMHALDAEAVA
jgi:dihydropteroate synthase